MVFLSLFTLRTKTGQYRTFFTFITSHVCSPLHFHGAQLETQKEIKENGFSPHIPQLIHLFDVKFPEE